ncbi:MAG: Rrf2 family transcriptional regulator [Lachnospiraceae bacterium]|nr:Rrf2 family transcriptional regulator [Lachnospiraceae bacterium]
MNFSKRSRYGIRALVDLAVYGVYECVQLSDIANRNGISVKYLEQIFMALRKAGLIKSIKGPQGGYLLADKPEKIQIAQVIYALDGDYLLDAEEVVPGKNGETAAAAIQKEIIEPMNELVDQFLRKLTLKDLADRFEEYNEYAQHMYYI